MNREEPGGLQSMGSQRVRHHRVSTHALHAAAKSLQLCPTLCDPIECSPPGSPIPGIIQARVLEWGAITYCKIQALAEESRENH